MGEDEEYDGADKRIDAADQDQNNYQSQDGQDDVLKISVSINSIHINEKNEIKELLFLLFFLRYTFSLLMFDEFIEKLVLGLLQKDLCQSLGWLSSFFDSCNDSIGINFQCVLYRII